MLFSKSLILLFFMPFLVVFGQEKGTEAAIPAEVQEIDPYSREAGEFFDTDLTLYSKGAFDAYKNQEYELSAKYYLAYLKHNIDDESALYNLACCYGLLEKDGLASRYLLEAVKAGYDNIEHFKQDPDFNPVRSSEVFSSIMDSLETIAEDEKAKQGKVVYIPSDVYFKSHVQFPRDFNPENTYTLLVGLHGWGATPERFVQLWERFGDDPDFIYVSPQAPYAFEVGDDMGYSWDTWITDDSLLAADVGHRTEQYVLNVIKFFMENYNIDHVFLTGFSQGGGYTYFIGLRNPDVFTGIMPLGGWMAVDWIGEEVIEEAKNLPVFIGHGKEDMRVEYKAAKEAKKILKKAGYDVTLYTFDGGHSVPEEECKALVEWMRQR